ncbi:MAG: alpha/beta fold hydrolase [Rubrivivax sp.]|nr:alpha/beta fold hydrolase [Rubrivivax sp.]
MALAAAAMVAAMATLPAAAESRPGLSPCRLGGVEHEALCGTLMRPLDPSDPKGTQIELHYAVLPALARQRKPDPVLFFAGGPGQSAIDLAGTVSRLTTRLGNRREVVLIDQRGTGRSAPLKCDEPKPTQPLADAVDPQRQAARLRACRERLQALPHGDLRHYTSWIAAQDADAVRQALGAAQVNLVGGSYGTRMVLELMRQFPQTVRRAVIDGVAPPDMALPAAFSPDSQAALDALWSACAAQPACAQRHPRLREDWRALLAALPREVTLRHPFTGAEERLTLDRAAVLGLARAPLYAPALAAGLPHAVGEAARGRFEPLVGLATALAGSRSAMLAEGMHFSVICAEDLPRLDAAADAPGADFGSLFADQYRAHCAGWPRGEVPAAFYALSAAPAATLVLSGGADPATPPRHGERVAQALGAKARHVVVPEAGHGTMALPCLRDAIFRFIDAGDDAAALAVDAGCAGALPRPPAFAPPGASSTAAEGAR